MFKKLIPYAIIGSLAVILIGGSAYLLALPVTDARLPEKQQQSLSSLKMAPPGDSERIVSKQTDEDRDTGGRNGIQIENPDVSVGGNNRSAEVAGTELSLLALTAEEKAGLLALREEEKLAHDVYLALYERWEFPAFQNISSSELNHLNTLRILMGRAGLDDPLADYPAGSFPTPEFQQLYDRFTAEGQPSLAAALRVAAAIEEIDILDIERLLAQTGNPELQTAYENLRQGSIRHLQSFRRAWETKTGETYQPQYLSLEVYNSLMSGAGNRGGDPQGDRTNGGGRRGNGNGHAA